MRDQLAKFLALLMACAMIASACSGSDSDGGSTDTDESGEDESSSPTTAVVTTTEPEEGAAGPTAGGKLVYGVEADSANPWAHYRVSCAISCYTILQTISDRLFGPLADGGVGGVLVETAEANEDYTVHTWTIRDGISFHDGTPLDAEAVAFNINACRGSGLTGPALSNIANVEADGQVLTLTTNTPHVPLPENFAAGQCSYMMSPTWLASLDDIPFRVEGGPFYSEEVAATPGGGDPAAPVGVGAFVFESYTPGNGNSFVATKNPDYWRGPNGITGEELPYLDEVEIVVAVDIASRTLALQSGEFDIIHTANADEIAALQDDGEVNVIAANDFGETSHIMLNAAQGDNAILGVPMDPEGANASSALLHKSCRRALAHATDNGRIAEERGAGLVEPANGPFPPGTIGYLEDTGYPAYDVDAALVEWEQCKTDAGTDTIQIVFNTTNDPFNVETNQMVADMWGEAFGDEIEVSIAPIEQGQYIGLALVGAFQAFGWRNHGGIDPDQQYLWWTAATASPIGSLALNFGRFQDPVIDENLAIQRASADPEVRRAAAEEINRSFGENVWNLWNTWTLWGIASNPNVSNIAGATSPDGDALRPVVSGRHDIVQVWCVDGNCQG